MFIAILKSHSGAITAPRSPPRIAPASTLGLSSWFWFSFSFPRFRFGLKMSPRLKRTDEEDCQLSKGSEEGVTHIDIAQEPGRWQGGRHTSCQARQGKDLFWALDHSPGAPFYVLWQGSLFLRLSERSKAKALLVPCSASISDIQLSQWIMRQYGHPGNSKAAKRELAQIVANVGDETGNSKEARQPHWALQAAACLPASLVSRECPTLAMTIITVNLFCSTSETLFFSEVFWVHKYNLLFWIGEKKFTKPPWGESLADKGRTYIMAGRSSMEREAPQKRLARGANKMTAV